MSGGLERNQVQAEYWEDRSAAWIEMEEYTTLVCGPFGRSAMDRLVVQPGERVLDIGCGTGPTTTELTRRVGPGGTVLGVDIATSLVAAARVRAEREGAENAEFVVGDAQSEELGDAVFDAAFSQFGVMFFSDPPAAFANLRRAIRDGGRIAFTCWQDIAANEWMFVPGAAMVAVTGELPPLPMLGEPGPFSLADAGRIEELLAGAEFRSIDVMQHAEDVVVDADPSTWWWTPRLASHCSRRPRGDDDPTFHEQIRAAIRAALLERVRDGQLRLAAAAFVVTAEATPG